MSARSRAKPWWRDPLPPYMDESARWSVLDDLWEHLGGDPIEDLLRAHDAVKGTPRPLPAMPWRKIGEIPLTDFARALRAQGVVTPSDEELDEFDRTNRKGAYSRFPFEGFGWVAGPPIPDAKCAVSACVQVALDDQRLCAAHADAYQASGEFVRVRAICEEDFTDDSRHDRCLLAMRDWVARVDAEARVRKPLGSEEPRP